MKKYIFLVSILTFSIAVQGRSRSGISMEAGAAYYYPFMLSLTPLYDIKLVMNGNDDNSDPHAGSYRNLPDNRFSLSFQAGVEYLFK
ncbi:hypothetical protein MNBD_BACTEROID07-292 [hydrothermal vent metagenome]|uniref:Uncharacterized protein n=1 Tax=hydrothermal vent metagenome TaxID=652676 RepID=A0A3B0V689_9ZZZZ